MGTSISFRERTPGLVTGFPFDEIPWATKMDSKLAFVRGRLPGETLPGAVEVGDDTDFPFKLKSLDQAMKILYRVKDAHLIQGYYGVTHTTSNSEGTRTKTTTRDYKAQAGSPTSQKCLLINYGSSGANDVNRVFASARGLTYCEEDLHPDAYEEEALGTGYTITVPGYWEGDPALAVLTAYDAASETFNWKFPRGSDPVYSSLSASRELKHLSESNRNSMGSAFHFFQTTTAGRWNEDSGPDFVLPSTVNGVVGKLEWQATDDEGPDDEINTSFASPNARIHVTPSIAYQGADDPMDPDANLYLQGRVIFSSNDPGGFSFLELTTRGPQLGGLLGICFLCEGR